MDAKVVFYIYTESLIGEIFTEVCKPAVLCEAVAATKSDSFQVFKECGGLKIKDCFREPHIHVRTSYWKTADAYADWLKNQRVTAYLKARADYQIEKNILAQLEGPFFGAMND